MQHQRSKSMCHGAWGAGKERVRITHGPVTACDWWCHHWEGRMRSVNHSPSHLSLNGHQKEIVRPSQWKTTSHPIPDDRKWWRQELSQKRYDKGIWQRLSSSSFLNSFFKGALDFVLTFGGWPIGPNFTTALELNSWIVPFFYPFSWAPGLVVNF